MPLFICNFLDFGQQSSQYARYVRVHDRREVALPAPLRNVWGGSTWEAVRRQNRL